MPQMVLECAQMHNLETLPTFFFKKKLCYDVDDFRPLLCILSKVIYPESAFFLGEPETFLLLLCFIFIYS